MGRREGQRALHFSSQILDASFRLSLSFARFIPILMPSFLCSDFRLSKKPVRAEERDGASTHDG